MTRHLLEIAGPEKNMLGTRNVGTNEKAMKAAILAPVFALPAVFGASVILNPGADLKETSFKNANPAKLSAGTWTTDNMHTSVGFTVGHLGLSQIQGRFDRTSGTITADPKNLDGASVTFTIETASINTNVTQRDDHLRTADFFDVAEFPQMKFVSTNIRRKGSGYVAEGKLTIKDVTKTIQIPFKAYGPVTDPQGMERVGMVSSPFTINRQDFHVAYDQKLPDGTPAVSNEVTIRLSLEAVASKSE